MKIFFAKIVKINFNILKICTFWFGEIQWRYDATNLKKKYAEIMKSCNRKLNALKVNYYVSVVFAFKLLTYA